MKTLCRFLRDECGATAIEYAMIASGISVVILAAVTQMGTTLKASYSTVAAKI